VTERGVGEINYDGMVVSDKKTVSNLFVKFFTNKVNNLLVDYEPKQWEEISRNLNVNNQTMFLLEDVRKALNRLSNKKKYRYGQFEWVFHKKV